MVLPILASAGGSLAGGLLGGLLGGSGPDAKLAPAKMSASGQMGLDALQARAERPEEAFAVEANQGLADDAQAVMSPETQQSVDIALGGPSLLGDAMRERSQKRFSSDINRLQRQGQIGAYDRRRKAEEVAYGLGRQKMQIDQDLAMRQLTYQREADAARNQVLGQVLGNAGQWVGMGLAQMKGPSPAATTAPGTAMPSTDSFWSADSYKMQGPLGGSK